MSVSTRREPTGGSGRGTAFLWLGLLAIVACAVIAAAVFVFSQPLLGASNSITKLQLRSRQLSADSLALHEAASERLLNRLTDQQAQTDSAVSAFVLQHGDQLDASARENLENAWRAASVQLSAQRDQAAWVLSIADARRDLTGQLDEAHAIGLSLARAVVAEVNLDPAERVAWLQWPVTLGELRLRVRSSQGDLAADMAAPISSALTDSQNLLAASEARLAPRARANLEAVLALLDTVSGRFARDKAIDTAPPPSPQGAELGVLGDVLDSTAAALGSERARWRQASQWAALLGVLALVSLALATLLRRVDLPVDAVVSADLQPPEGDAVQRKVDDSKRDDGIARALARVAGRRFAQLQTLNTDAKALFGHVARLTKPRELVLRLGRQHAASQRALTNQMATTTARLSDVSKLARQWAERSDESHRLMQSMRELGERAALLQVNACIRVGDSDAGLADDFQRLNDCVRSVTAQTEALARRQNDASRRTLDGLQRSVESQAATETTASKAGSQLRAYVNGQEDLSGRYDKLEAQLKAHAAAMSALHQRAKADRMLEQRVLKANRAAAHFASRVGQGSDTTPSDVAGAPPARSASRRVRRTESDTAEADG